MNRYEETHAALVKLLDDLDQLQDQKAATVEAIQGFASGLSGNPAAIMMQAPKLAPLVGQFMHDQNQFEAGLVATLHRVAEAVETAMDEEDEANAA